MKKVSALAVLLALSLAALACSSPAAAPTQAPTAPAKAAQKVQPAATATPSAAKPAATTATQSEPQPAKPAAPSEGRTNWQAEWDKIVAAAKQEGKLTIGGARGPGYREAVDDFAKAYPEIKLDYTPMAGADAAPRILGERNSGVFLWDIYMGGSGTIHASLLPVGAVEPLRPNLILPEVLDDSKWNQGFEDGWTDLKKSYVYAFLGYLSFSILINRDVPGASEIKTLDDLLDPKWKGKIVWQDPRRAGSGSQSGGNILFHKGEDWYRKLLSNDIVALTDARMVLERLARAEAVAAIGTREDEEMELKALGLLKNTEYLDDGTPAVAHMTAGSGNLATFDRPPHPNAQALFANWLLSKQGQEAYVKSTGIHSRRLDVPPGRDLQSLPKPGIKYKSGQKEENLETLNRGYEIAKEVLR